MNSLNKQQNLSKFSEQEFDSFLRDIDDLYGEASGLAVPPNFMPRIVELAMTEQKSVMRKNRQSWSIRGWFFDFSYAARFALASALLLAGFGGFRAGQVLTGLIASRNNQRQVEFADPLWLAIPEQAIVQLIRHDGLTAGNQPNKTFGGAR